MSARLRVAALTVTGALTLATPAQAAPEARTATVVFDPATTGAEAIAAASASAGYPARVAG